MAKILLIEDVHQFTPNPESIKAISEAVSRGGIKYPVVLEGRLSVIGVRNENNRRYTRKVWEKQLQEGSALRQLITHRRSVGLLEHPGDGNVSLQSPISHVLMDVYLKESDGNAEIFGKIGFINTGEGNKMIALIEAGYNPLVSSRGYGSVVKASDGVDEVQDDYVCEGWDVVWNPSFKTAEMDGSKLRGENAKKTESVLVETVSAPIKTDSPDANLYESKTAETYTTMSDKFKVIRESLTPIATADVAKLPPRAIVETLARCGDLHRQAAVVGSTDATLSWDVHQIHSEISAQEQRLTDAMAEPQKRVASMNEQSVKTLKTMKLIAETAMKFKTAAAKYLKEAEAKSLKLKETIERGHGWVKRAKLAESKASLLDRKYQYACEAVDEIHARYQADVTELGRRVLQLEFADKFADAEMQKKLNEATTLKDLVALRETVEGKVAEGKAPPFEKDGSGEKKGKKEGDGEKKAAEDKKDDKKEEAAPAADAKPVVTESKKEEAAPAPKADANKPGPRDLAPLQEAVLIGGNRSFDFTEQAACIRRLSESRK